VNTRERGLLGPFFFAAALLALSASCAGAAPAVEKRVGPIPELVEAGDAARAASIYVTGPGEFGELKGHLERAFLKAGYKVVKTPIEATLVVTVGDAGGSFGTAGIEDGLSVSDTTRKIVATVTADGRQVDEATVESSFSVRQKQGEQVDSLTKRLSEQSTASWKLIANTIANSVTVKLGTSAKPAAEGKSI